MAGTVKQLAADTIGKQTTEESIQPGHLYQHFVSINPHYLSKVICSNLWKHTTLNTDTVITSKSQQ